ncbi:hypothetical protein ACQ3I4_09575 [Zafaria sp. Z1313]|uniref:hypothetical protein n=1 Tax=unclassified Zafaria TaxID=2828765 RepID=UPI002E7A9403|nr:hypothetical protein [Zafaria sp. J156]MEE1621832.1 hypothetical protein [Zafaria sp. J156]
MEKITDPLEVLDEFVHTPELILGTLLILALIAGLALPALKALGGTWRSWVLAPGVVNLPMTWFQTRHKWPYMLLCMAVALTLMLPTIYFEAARDEHMRQLWWTLPFFWVPWLLTVVSFFYWPLWATPRWNRAWEARRRHEARAIPFTDAEVAAVEAMPEGRGKRRLERNIAASRRYAAGHENAFASPRNSSPGESPRSSDEQKGPESR